MEARGALPQALPTDKRLEPGELVVLDFGCFVDGYASDMTRTIALGEPGEEARKVYDIVLDAQQQAIAQAQAGISTKDLDAAARSVIEAGHLSPKVGRNLDAALFSIIPQAFIK